MIILFYSFFMFNTDPSLTNAPLIQKRLHLNIFFKCSQPTVAFALGAKLCVPDFHQVCHLSPIIPDGIKSILFYHGSIKSVNNIVTCVSSDEQNIFCLYKGEPFCLFAHCIWLTVLKKPYFPLFSFTHPSFSIILIFPPSLPFFSHTQISLVFFPPILIYFLLSVCFSTH